MSGAMPIMAVPRLSDFCPSPLWVGLFSLKKQKHIRNKSKMKLLQTTWRGRGRGRGSTIQYNTIIEKNRIE
jgi:hypothetical protein